MDLEKLIELVRSEEILFNYNDKHYHDATKKEKVWMEIADKLRQNVKECKKQWNALRDAFRRHKKKRLTKSGQAAAIIKKWKFEEEMSFLLPFMQDRATVSSIEMTSPEESQVETEAEPEIIEAGSHEPLNEGVPIEQHAPKTSVVQQQQLQKKRKKEKTTASAVVMDYLLKKEEKDEVEALFYGLAQTVKKMPPYYRALAKARVCSIVGEIEIQSITNPNPPVMASTYMYPGNTYQTHQYSTSSNISTSMSSPPTQQYSTSSKMSNISTPTFTIKYPRFL